MRMLVGAVLATVLMGAASVAYAADATGKIKSLDMTKDVVTLTVARVTWCPRV